MIILYHGLGRSVNSSDESALFLDLLSSGWVDDGTVIIVYKSIEGVQSSFVVCCSGGIRGLLCSSGCFRGISGVDVSVGRISTTDSPFVAYLDHLWLLVMMFVVSVMLFSGG